MDAMDILIQEAIQILTKTKLGEGGFGSNSVFDIYLRKPPQCWHAVQRNPVLVLGTRTAFSGQSSIAQYDCRSLLRSKKCSRGSSLPVRSQSRRNV